MNTPPMTAIVLRYVYPLIVTLTGGRLPAPSSVHDLGWDAQARRRLAALLERSAQLHERGFGWVPCTKVG